MLGRLFSKIDRKAPPERHCEPAPQSEGSVLIDGQAYPLVNWSQSGFLAKDYTGDRGAREKVEVTLSVMLAGNPFEFTTTAMFVRVDSESRKVVGAFVDMETSLKVEFARRLGA